VLCIILIHYMFVVILSEKIHTHTKIIVLTNSVPHRILTFAGHSPPGDGAFMLLMNTLGFPKSEHCDSRVLAREHKFPKGSSIPRDAHVLPRSQ